jgi:predicted acylesterase/phospholipase RssA
MSNLSLRQLAQRLQTDQVSAMAAEVHFAWPPPPVVSLRRLFACVPYGAIVFSGGGTRTDFQVGAVRYILERGFDLFVVCGSSGGSPNAAKIAEGEGSASLERYWRGLTSFRDIYLASDWLQTLINDPVVGLLYSFLFLGHSEALIGFISGGIASTLFQLAELPNLVGWAQGIETIFKLGIDLTKIFDDISTIFSAPVKSMFSSDPIHTRLNGSFALQGRSGWFQIGYGNPGSLSAISIAVVMGLDARLEVFIIDGNTSVQRAHQADIASPLDWTDFSVVPTPTTPSSIAVAAVNDGSGKIQVFRLGSDALLYQAAESAPTAGAPLSAWTPLTVGHTAFKASMVCIVDGVNRVRLLSIGTDSAVYQISETATGSGVYGSWTQIGASSDLALSIRAALNFDLRLEAVRITADGHIFHAAEESAGGAFSAWEQLAQVPDTTPLGIAIDIVRDSAGFLQICCSGSDGNVYVARQLVQGFYFGSWIRLPRPPQAAGLIRFGTDADGTCQLLLIGTDRTLYHSRQEVAGGSWTSWFPVTPGFLSYVFGPTGASAGVPFSTEEVYDLACAQSWNGQLEVFVRGHQYAPLHVSHRVPMLDFPKVQTSAIRLRMSVVSLESGRLRYADENGRFVDNPAEGQFSLGDAVVASGAVPGTFPPIKLITDNYIDGGTRDNLPIKAAVDAGANSVISIVATQPVTLPNPSYDNANMFDILSRGITDIMPNQVLQDDLNPPVPWPIPTRAVQVSDLGPPYNTVHGEAGIERGLVAIAIDYGYMRAYDDLDPTATPLNNNPGPALHDNTNAIVNLRLQIWELEHAINGKSQPLQDVVGAVLNKLNGTPELTPVPDSTPLPQLRLMKWQLKALVDKRRVVLGGRVPRGVESWWLNWEEHSWDPIKLTPWMELQVGPGPKVQAEPPPLGDDNRLIAEQSATTNAYVIFGGAKFVVPLPWKTFTWGAVNRVPDGALQFDQTLAAYGTVIKEDGSATTFVIFGGAKFAIPGLPWQGAVPGTSSGAVSGVNIVPSGSLGAVSNIPVDRTILVTVDGGGTVQSTYQVFGGAKFLVPLTVLSDLNLSAQLGFLRGAYGTVPLGGVNQIPDIPRNGTVLKEINGADPFVIQNGKKMRVIGPRRFFDLGLFWPEVGIVWDHALDAFPDGGLA